MLESILAFISTHWVTVLAIYGAVVALASAIVKLTPSQTDDAILAKIVKFLDWFSTVYPKLPKTGISAA